MTTSVTRPCFTKQHQNCKTKTKTTACKTKTKTDFWVSDWSCPKTDGLRPHHCIRSYCLTKNDHIWQGVSHAPNLKRAGPSVPQVWDLTQKERAIGTN